MHSASVCGLSRGQVRISSPKSCTHQQCWPRAKCIMQSGHFFRTFCATYFKHVICKCRLHLCIWLMLLSKVILNGFTNAQNAHHLICICISWSVCTWWKLTCIYSCYYREFHQGDYRIYVLIHRSMNSEQQVNRQFLNCMC